jgi:hypothetical protein
MMISEFNAKNVNTGARSSLGRAGAFILMSIARGGKIGSKYWIELHVNRYGLKDKTDLRSVLFSKLAEDIERVVKNFNLECEKYKAESEQSKKVEAIKDL